MPQRSGTGKIRQIADAGLPESGNKAAARWGELVAELERGLGRLGEQMIERLWDHPDLVEITLAERRAPSERIARSNLAHEVRALRDKRLPIACPAEAAEAARAAVSYDAPVTIVLQCYRAGHAVLWDAWTETVEERVEDPAEQRQLLHEAGAFMFEYADRCSSFVERAYQLERERAARALDQQRAQAVTALLGGDPVSTDELRYDLDAIHAAAVATGPAAEEVLRQLGQRPGVVDFLLVRGTKDAWWGWYALEETGDPHLVAHAPRGRGVVLSFGGPAHGPAGFTAAHQQALWAHPVAARRTTPAAYADVALEAVALADVAHAAAFASRELGPLAASEARAVRLRETLAVYFRSAQNAASTAAALGVHERTISNRLRAIEELLGRHPVERRAELELALRLHALVA